MSTAILINVLGLVVGIAGTGFGVWGFLRQQTARAAERAAKRKLMTQVASRHFSDLSARALRLSGLISRQEGERAREEAMELYQLLQKAKGAWKADIIPSDEKDNIDGAIVGVGELLERLPLDGNPVDPNDLQLMLLSINTIAGVTAGLAGRLETIEELRED